MSELIFKLWSDEEIRSVIQLFEYDPDWYDNYHGSAKEVLVDKTLQYLSYLCYLRKQRVLKEEEFDMFEYEITHLFQNRSAIRYLKFLHGFSNAALGDGKHVPFPFRDLLDYGLDHGLVKKEDFPG